MTPLARFGSALALVLLLTSALAGCGDDGEDRATVTSEVVEAPGAYGIVPYSRRVTTVDLTVGGTGGVTGQARDAEGAPRPKARVTLTLVAASAGAASAEEPSAVDAATTTSRRGWYGFANVPAGRWRVRCRNGDGTWTAKVVQIQAGAVATRHFTEGLMNLFFLHHSTGAGIVFEGDVRGCIQTYNQQHGTSYTFWDHGYNGDGLTDPDGNNTGTNYDIPNDNTDPDGLAYLWSGTGSDAVQCRNRILSNHEVIAFKSCFPASAIPDAGTLSQYKAWYLAMRDFFDTRTDRVFVVMSTPPLHRRSTNSTEAKNARRFADWLKSDAYLSGHPNVVCFDLFDVLAKADDGSATANMLRYEYEGSHSNGDSHPNTLANQTVGPVFAQALIDAARSH